MKQHILLVIQREIDCLDEFIYQSLGSSAPALPDNATSHLIRARNFLMDMKKQLECFHLLKDSSADTGFMIR